jgi:hypothetical protein
LGQDRSLCQCMGHLRPRNNVGFSDGFHSVNSSGVPLPKRMENESVRE